MTLREFFAGAEREIAETLRNRTSKVSKNIGCNAKSDVNLAHMQHILLDKSVKDWLQFAGIQGVFSVENRSANDDIL